MSKFNYTPEQEAFNKKYGLTDKDYWSCHNNPVVLHSACEKVALKEGIKNLDFEIIEINSEKRLAVIKCSGSLHDRHECSFGEASPKNTVSAYFVAMAEKRAKDRVILKLVGMSGLLYSESDVVKKEGKWEFADEVGEFETTTEEQLAKAVAEVKNLNKKEIKASEKS
tara:strand:+ start:1118 stop:1621 length:504 start_codon:yes stop_codon:yes gene_type:complete